MIEKDRQILDVVSDHPETEAVFKGYDKVAGVCILCTHLFDSVEQVANRYNLDLDELLVQLNEKAGDDNGSKP